LDKDRIQVGVPMHFNPVMGSTQAAP
jgi:hypothetical protein